MFAFAARRKARTDDPNPFPALAVGNKHHMPSHCTADRDLAAVLQLMVRIRERHRKRVKEYGCRVVEPNAMLLEVRTCFSRVPLESHATQV